jgi:sigma-B regulation protein RsbU (phosphoserine phosphatase)
MEAVSQNRSSRILNPFTDKNTVMGSSTFSDFFRPRSLQQRTALFILVPTFFLLTAIGVAGFFAVRNILIEQWGEASIAKLQRAAHHIDMGLNRPKELLQLLQDTAAYDSGKKIHNFVIAELRQMDGVVNVKVDWPDTQTAAERKRMAMVSRHNTARQGTKSPVINPPVYDFTSKNKMISLVAEFNDSEGSEIGRVEVLLSFDTLNTQTIQMSWLNIHKTYIVDMQGNILTSTLLKKEEAEKPNTTVFGRSGELETKTLAALQQQKAGTVFGPGLPPKEISGFYRLEAAPWTLIVIAPGVNVLQPMLRFRNFYLASFLVSILFILWFIRSVTAKTTLAIKEVSRAAGRLAQGKFGAPLTVTTRDEVGELIRNFNLMTSQLEHGAHLQKSIEIAREVQQNFLPQKSIKRPEMEVSGLSVYCDETGGDFFDVIELPADSEHVGVAVGDVVGHGIGAALLMATIRALLRSRLDQPGTLAEKIADVNRLLCSDTVPSGNFASLFYLVINSAKRELKWVRAGHDPAILYYPRRNHYGELKGEGLVLGFDANYPYCANSLQVEQDELIILIGSDGAWEVENVHGEQFGKQRIKDLIALHHPLPPAQLLQVIIEAIEQFRKPHPQDDDITLVAINMAPHQQPGDQLHRQT